VTDDPLLADRLRALATLVPRLEAAGAEAEFGAWVPSSEREAGVWSMPYVEYGPLERAFHAACGGWMRPAFNWPAWAATPDAIALRDDPERLAQATPDDLAHLITAVIRADRFNEGLLLDSLKSGLLARIARRASSLAAALEGSG
jgi:hypothetical protein